jgi:catechol 2,3-dioxygenase-like lactoylglutathione lyase family enzyme
MSKKKSILQPKILSHCTCEVIDIKKTRKLYEEVLGLEIVEDGPKAMYARLNSVTVIRVVETDTKSREHKHASHMGFDVATKADVDAARDTLLRVQERYGIKEIQKIKNNHGNRSFCFIDFDNNDWEILDNPVGGYRWRFEQGGDLDRAYKPNQPNIKSWRHLVDPETNEMKSGS